MGQAALYPPQNDTLIDVESEPVHSGPV
ncbi:hypothetical protein AZE42_12449 [Rhizopogon vesiculosus]|uniref:Uncharacterized protein n=1 Tax=Rhizopogon vesiculosus TaxID=180088 RepID=A0A1J8PJ05_9AGAM|nr:hypothetical protein AZE42_12449 [Rhizopogon vesiculosus]